MIFSSLASSSRISISDSTRVEHLLLYPVSCLILTVTVMVSNINSHSILLDTCKLYHQDKKKILYCMNHFFFLFFWVKNNLGYSQYKKKNLGLDPKF